MALKLATRLWLPTLAMAGLMALMGVTVAPRTAGQIARTDELLRDSENKLLDAAEWRGLTQANAVRVVAGLASSDPAVAAAMKPEIAATSAHIGEIQKRVETAAIDPAERALLERIAGARKAYLAAREATTGKSDWAGQVQPAINAYLASQQAYIDLQKEHTAAVRAQAGADRMRTVWGVLGVMAVIVAGLAFGTVLLVRSICRPVDQLAGAARRIGEGDLDVAVDIGRDDEIGSLQRSLATMRDALRGIVGQVRQSAESIQVASAEVAGGNADLSQRTEQAASHLQQTASSLELLTSNVRQSADAAAQANQLASSASSVARRGGEVVGQVVSTMDEINHSSKRIADIIGTIDGIAFQTNILALNAAVEAARAGEQGRGFAVVASEVRNLAQRSAEAAREIKTLIGSSVDKVETGARLVQDAGATMGEIVASVQRVSDVIGEITAAAGEQSSGIGQVNGAVASLDQMTQQNAALVEQSAAAAESLREQAQRLSQSMQVFRLTAHDDADSATAVATAPVVVAAPPKSTPAAVTAPRRAAAAPARTPTPPAPRATTPATPRPPDLAAAAIDQARETSRQAPPPGDDWESF
jgi:methyl-accepting chemotaxis protein